MGKSEQNVERSKHAEQVDSLRKRADIIFEDYPYKEEEIFDSAIGDIGLIHIEDFLNLCRDQRERLIHDAREHCGLTLMDHK